VAKRAADGLDEQWIAKYRASLQEFPLARRRFEPVRKMAQEIWDRILGHVGRVFGRAQEAERRPKRLTGKVKKETRNSGASPTRKMKAS
jgi:hypothetical protein